MILLQMKCYEDSSFGDMYDEETYSKPIYEEFRWEGTLIASEFGGFEGHVKSHTQDLFIFGYFIPNKGLVLYEFGKNSSTFNIMNIYPDINFSVNKDAEILNPNYSFLKTNCSYHDGGYEVVNHIYNDFCGSTESHCRIVIEDIREVDKDEVNSNEEIQTLLNNILKQRETLQNKHRRLYMQFYYEFSEFTKENPNQNILKL